MTSGNHSFLTKVVDLLVDAVCVVDAEGRYVFVNSACEDLFGYSQEDLVGRNMIDLVHPQDRERTLQAADEIMRGQPLTHFENRYIRKDGRVIHVTWSARWSENDRLRLAVARDVTELKHAERMQEISYRITEAAHLDQGLAAYYRDIRRILRDSLPAKEVSIVLYGRDSGLLSLPSSADGGMPRVQPLDPESDLARVLKSGRPLRTAAGGAGTSVLLGVPLISAGAVTGALVAQGHAGGPSYSARDQEVLECVATRAAVIIERKQAESRLHHMAHHDALTDLPNRTLFHDRFETALRRARRNGERLALLTLDLNGFKAINDTLGHVTGDRLLRDVARQLQDCVRESDTIARLGGDEFTVLLTDVSAPADAETVEAKIRAAIGQPFEADGQTLSVSVSIGAAVYPEHGDNPEALLRHADAMMYAAKRESRE